MKSFVIVIMLVLGTMHVTAESKFRNDDFEPTIVQRSGLALLRIVSSPLSLFTEGVQYYNENQEATGESNPFYFVVGMCLQGSFVTCFEAVGGCLELISFQQFKSFAYPWEIDENDARMVNIIREDRERERLQEEMKPESNFIGEMIGAAAGAAVGTAISGKHQTQPSRIVTGGSKSPSSYSSGSRSNIKPLVRHSSCHGTGKCNVCNGNGYVGRIVTTQDKTRLRCRSCGGSGICRPCNGTGYAR